MNKPTDYPLADKNSDKKKNVHKSDMTYAMLRDRVNQKKPVTDEMIRSARAKMDTAHIKKKKTESKSKLKLENIREKLRLA